MAYKIVISKAGYNALTETNPDNLAFSSDYNSLKYHVSGSTSIVINGTPYFETTQTVTVAHNLGYIPVFIVYARCTPDVAGQFYIPTHVNLLASTWLARADCYCDDTNLTLQAYLQSFTPSGPTTMQFSYYYKIFRNNTAL